MTPVLHLYDRVTWFLTKPMQRAWEHLGCSPAAAPKKSNPDFALPHVAVLSQGPLLWDLAALGLSLIGQPLTLPKGRTACSEAWCLMPPARLYVALAPLPPAYSQEGLRSELDVRPWMVGHGPALPPTAFPRTRCLLLGGLGFGSVEASDSRAGRCRFEGLWTSHLIPGQGLRPREGSVSPG